MNTRPTRSRLAAACAGLAAVSVGCADPPPPPPDAVAMLGVRSRASNAALMRGEVARYVALVSLAQDFTLFSPFGGEPTRGLVEAAAIARRERVGG
jgi:hypothetical protein